MELEMLTRYALCAISGWVFGMFYGVFMTEMKVPRSWFWIGLVPLTVFAVLFAAWLTS